jgi:putative ABC transport system substrate-binding protein
VPLAELLALGPDVLLVHRLGIRAARDATRTIPIIFIFASDPVAAGLVDSLAHPGGNVTGFTAASCSISSRRGTTAMRPLAIAVSSRRSARTR